MPDTCGSKVTWRRKRSLSICPNTISGVRTLHRIHMLRYKLTNWKCICAWPHYSVSACAPTARIARSLGCRVVTYSGATCDRVEVQSVERWQ